jgi:predicted transcriptional regulator
MMKKVTLSSKKELEIYMNPLRQQLIRQMDISKEPMTPKMLADKLHISASSVQHHIKKLMSLGLIELDHTKLINGITASYYKPTYASVQIGLEHTDDTAVQREILMQDRISRAYDGFLAQKKKIMSRFDSPDSAMLRQWGDIMAGVVHLTDREAQELMKFVTEYIERHAAPAGDRFPWEYAIILYNAREEIED